MSSSSDDQCDKECPLCMEPLELDDIYFYPCKCEYQICRFCWHRIRTDGNGLCPACRQRFPEDPVNFKPLSSVDIQRHHNEKKMKKQAEKVRITETRQHLANYRVLQKNLVYVVGLSSRVADPELLKKNEYFGRYGKILKVVTSLAPNIHPHQHLPASYTAYVTYKKVEEALRAIQGVNNSYLDGRSVKASLGTTKYCSAFLQSRKCFKPECMYLHENAEPEISFTKEDMHAGKHTEFEKRLSDTLLNRPPPPTQTVASIIEKSIALGCYRGGKEESSSSASQAKPLVSQWEAETDGDNELEEETQRHSAFEMREDVPDNTSCKSTDSTSVEDPAPSNPSDDTIDSKRSNASARERQWSERDEISVAPSHSPPTDPEANEDLDEVAEHRLEGMMSTLGISAAASATVPPPRPVEEEQYSSFLGVPAPAEHHEAPAPLVNWQTLLGLSSPQHTHQPDSLFSSFMAAPLSRSVVVPPPPPPAAQRMPSPPPGLSRYGSDDELGFDPFTESAKGLSALLQEEEEMPSSSAAIQHQQHQQQQQQHPSLSQLLYHQQQQQQHQQQSLLHQLHQQQQQQQQHHGLSSLWSSPSPFSTNQQQMQHQQQQQQHQQQMMALQNSLMQQDPFSSLQILRQQQMAAAQAQQQQQQQQGMFYQDLAAARQAASSIFSQMQQHQQYAVAPPPGLTSRPTTSSQQWHQQQQQQNQPQHQQQQPPSMSMQETFKALLPNVNVRFMDDSAMSRWSAGASTGGGSGAVPPPPGFSSVLNR